ncbi:unnamed protein product [Closterium sp. NIES-65]|nr:unnamed protein product [Closterium sp. NIES-65]
MGCHTGKAAQVEVREMGQHGDVWVESEVRHGRKASKGGREVVAEREKKVIAEGEGKGDEGREEGWGKGKEDVGKGWGMGKGILGDKGREKGVWGRDEG